MFLKKSRSQRRQTWFPGVSSYQDELDNESPLASPSKKLKPTELPEISDSMTRRLQSLQVEAKDLKSKITLLEDEKRDYSRTLKATSLQCQKLAQDSKIMGKNFRNNLLEILVLVRDLKEACRGDGKALHEKIDFLEFETKSFTVAYNDLIRAS